MLTNLQTCATKKSRSTISPFVGDRPQVYSSSIILDAVLSLSRSPPLPLPIRLLPLPFVAHDHSSVAPSL